VPSNTRMFSAIWPNVLSSLLTSCLYDCCSISAIRFGFLGFGYRTHAKPRRVAKQGRRLKNALGYHVRHLVRRRIADLGYLCW